MKTSVFVLYAYDGGLYSTRELDNEYLIWSAVLKVRTTYEDIGQGMTETHHDLQLKYVELYGDLATKTQRERIEEEINKLDINQYL